MTKWFFGLGYQVVVLAGLSTCVSYLALDGGLVPLVLACSLWFLTGASFTMSIMICVFDPFVKEIEHMVDSIEEIDKCRSG